MAGCMRYCTLSMNARMPRASMRSKRLVPRPAASASREMMVGGSCFWSPMSTIWRHPFRERHHRRRFRRLRGFVDEARLESNRSRKSDPAPAHVAQITSARLKTPLIAWYCWSLDRAHPGSMPAMDSTMYCIRSWRTASGRPTRATRTPARLRPSTRLSTAMFESRGAQNRTRAASQPHLHQRHRGVRLTGTGMALESTSRVGTAPLPSASVWLLFMWDMARRSIAWSIIFCL